jgi:hypothetical protein
LQRSSECAKNFCLLAKREITKWKREGGRVNNETDKRDVREGATYKRVRRGKERIERQRNMCVTERY